MDETLPLRFGLIGQETTGPGGFAKALRTVPAGARDRRGVRGARRARTPWILDFTNPVGIVTQALLDAGHRAIGLCNVAIGFQRSFARHFDVAPERVSLDHVGLNHLSWIRAVRVDGVDRLPELLEAGDEAVTLGGDFPLAVVRALGAIPSYYLHYYYATDDVLRAQRDGASRATDVIRIEQELLDLYRDPTLDHKPELLERRGGAYYSEAAAALIESLHTGDGAVHVVDTRNRGAIPNLPDDAVVEVPARIDRTGATPIPTAPLAPEMLGLVQHVKAYEALAIEAALSGSDAVALRALVANPLVHGDVPGAPRRDHRGQPAVPPPLRPDAAPDGRPASPAGAGLLADPPLG